MIHKGNSVLDSRGCILVGESWQWCELGKHVFGTLGTWQNAKLLATSRRSVGGKQEGLWLSGSGRALEALQKSVVDSKLEILHIVQS